MIKLRIPIKQFLCKEINNKLNIIEENITCNLTMCIIHSLVVFQKHTSITHIAFTLTPLMMIIIIITGLHLNSCIGTQLTLQVIVLFLSNTRFITDRYALEIHTLVWRLVYFISLLHSGACITLNRDFGWRGNWCFKRGQHIYIYCTYIYTHATAAFKKWKNIIKTTTTPPPPTLSNNIMRPTEPSGYHLGHPLRLLYCVCAL